MNAKLIETDDFTCNGQGRHDAGEDTVFTSHPNLAVDLGRKYLIHT